jgi:hypothetical protein
MTRHFDTINDKDVTVHCWRAQKQKYSNCMFSAGIVTGNDPDTMYLRLEQEGKEPTTIFLRPDEAQTIIFVLSGALWSKLMEKVAP